MSFESGSHSPDKRTPLSMRLASGLNVKQFVNNIEVHGREHLKEVPEGRRVILAPTHVSDLDVPLTIHTLGNDFNLGVAVESTMLDPRKHARAFAGVAAAGISNFHGIDFDHTQTGNKAGLFNPKNFEAIAKQMEAGKDILVAAHNPSRDGQLIHGGYGAVYLSQITDALIIPVAINVHAKEAVLVGQNAAQGMFNRSDADVTIGEPIEPEHIEGIEQFATLLEKRHGTEPLTDDDVKEFHRLSRALKTRSEEVMRTLAAMMPEEKRGPYRKAQTLEDLAQKADLERQLRNASKLVIESKDRSSKLATIVRVTKIDPPEDKITNPRRLVLAGGWAKPLETYEPLLGQFYQDGQPTLTFDIPRAGGELPDLAPDELEAIKEFIDTAPEEVRSARILLEVLAAENELQTDVLAHSRGFGHAAIAALIDDVRAKKEGRENRIRNIVAYSPMGLIGDDSLVSLATRTLLEDSGQVNWGPDFGQQHIPMEQLARDVANEREARLRHGELPPPETDPSKILQELQEKKAAAEARGITEYGPADPGGVEIAKSIGKAMLPGILRQTSGTLDTDAPRDLLSSVKQAGKGFARVYREGQGPAKMRVEDTIPKLRKIGIGLAIARGTDDKIVPADRIAQYMKWLRELGVLDISMTGVHDTPNRDPRTAHIFKGLFTELEKQRETTQ